MVKNKRNTRTDLYDLCSCYEPIELPPEGTFDTFKEPEPTLENTSFYATEEDGKLYFYCGKTKIEVIEHFADNGKALNTHPPSKKNRNYFNTLFFQLHC